MSQVIFVYGSLKQGYALHSLLHRQLFLGNAVTAPKYRLFDLGSYPGLVACPEGLAIHGEVYQVDANALHRLDEAEGVADALYARREIQLQSDFVHRSVHAWFWLGDVSGKPDCGARWP
ncbi:MAG: gamma-glutamylcyclotransferase [Planctomycetaceae bacterium]|nr:gamma-glutamylcyclotransferase [Planctomycetaceae bacterium]